MMNYVLVRNATSSYRMIDYDRAAIAQTGNALVSIIGGLKQKRFGFDTLYGVMEHIREVKRRHIDPIGGELFLDSGGYSIIVGDVSPEDIPKFIDCYNVCLVKERPADSWIFSLDIPFRINDPEFNTRKNIEDLNRRSLETAREILLAHPEIRDRFYFVWHFKMPGQYEIWNKLYEELSLNDIICNRAIGGMVGIHGAAKIRFSPFTGMAFRCLQDYLEARSFGRGFRLHFLGVYIVYDRFQIALLDKLFQRYLAQADIAMESVLTYDSVNFARTSLFKAKGMAYYDLHNGALECYPDILSVPSEVFRGVYYDDELYVGVQDELANFKAGAKSSEDVDAFTALNVHSNTAIDRYFSHIIDANQIVDILFESSTAGEFASKAGTVLDGLSSNHKRLFSRDVCKAIKRNFEETYIFHEWFTKGRDYVALDTLMRDVIQNKIRFPANLS